MEYKCNWTFFLVWTRAHLQESIFFLSFVPQKNHHSCRVFCSTSVSKGWPYKLWKKIFWWRPCVTHSYTHSLNSHSNSYGHSKRKKSWCKADFVPFLDTFFFPQKIMEWTQRRIQKFLTTKRRRKKFFLPVYFLVFLFPEWKDLQKSILSAKSLFKVRNMSRSTKK